MANATPAIRSFSGGEFSALMEGRTDLEYYPSSLRNALNCILTPQGPVIGRSGSLFSCAARTDDESSTLIPFVFSEEQAQIIEFSDDRLRFVDEAGLQTYTPAAFTLTSIAGAPIEFTSAGLGAAIGDQIVFSGYDPEYNLNGEVATITAKSGSDYETDYTFPVLPVANGLAARVYHVALPYTEAQRKTLNVVQDTDLMYLLVDGAKPKKLLRYDDYDWRLSDFTFIDGPYLDTNATTTTLTPAATGNAVPAMTTNTAPSGTAAGSSKRGTVAAGATFLGRTIPLGMAATDYFNAFDNNTDETVQTYWASNTAQRSHIQYTPAAAFTADGYSIHLAVDNEDAQYSMRDYAPRTWAFQGLSGATWVTLDKQIDYAAWDNNKSPFFKIKKPASYTSYRLVVQRTVKEGPLETRVGRLVIRSTTSKNTTLTASSVVGINNDKGFLSTDVGRLVRLQGSDGFWRAYEITDVNSTTSIDVTLLGEPLKEVVTTTQWRLGVWSDTTGWPSSGTIHNDRLYLAGGSWYPNAVAGSVVGSYEAFLQTEPDGAVLDDGAILRFVKGQRSVKIQWITSDDKGLIIGTTGGEYAVIKPSNFQNYTPSGFDVRRSTERGCANVEPIRVDNKILYVQKNRRTLRQFQYTFERDNYGSDNLSKFASHLGVPKLVEMDFAAEPHSMVWIRRGDNTVVSLTYSPDDGESILGWARHDFAGAIVESIAVIPQEDQRQDMLWLATRRTINGSQKRYIEYLKRPWDFGDTLNGAHFVDCGIRYVGPEITTVYGLQHLEGQTIVGLANNEPISPKQVIGGSIELDNPATRLVLGLGFESNIEISRLDTGAIEGTALGKKQRVFSCALAVWDTATGQVGKFDYEYNEWHWEDLEFKEDLQVIQPIRLHTEITRPIEIGAGWHNASSLAFRRKADQPLPFNCIALFPRLEVTDNG